MDFKIAMKALENNSDFKKWKKKNKDSYFSYAFKIPQEMGDDEWQLGFYNRKNEKITTFIAKGNDIDIRPEEDVFKKEDTKVNEIQIGKVKIAFENSIEKASQFQQKNYPKDKSVKTIVILQNLPKLGNIWNITYVTGAFNTLNMKIDASTGKVIENHISSVFSFRKDDAK